MIVTGDVRSFATYRLRLTSLSCRTCFRSDYVLIASDLGQRLAAGIPVIRWSNVPRDR